MEKNRSCTIYRLVTIFDWPREKAEKCEENIWCASAGMHEYEKRVESFIENTIIAGALKELGAHI
jgi:hypothetical protein